MGESAVNTPDAIRPKPSLLDLGMRLHLPYNNDFGLIEKLIPYAPSIKSIYLPCNHTILGSGRYEGRTINRNWENYDAEVKDIAKIVAPYDIKVNMLLNSLHVSSDILNNFHGSALYRYLKGYEESDVEWLTIANIQLAMLVRRYFPRFKLDVSVLGLIDTVKRAQYWYDLVRPDLFCVDLDRSKDLSLIRNITTLTGVPVKVLVMDFCLPDCPYKPWHYIHNALKEENAFSCWQIRADKPWYYYKGRSIPPYYLRRYAGLIQDIKIVERNSDTETILRNIQHYAENSDSRYMIFNGGVVKEGDSPPAISSSVDKLYFNLNSKHPLFKPVPEYVFERTLTCDLNCGVCRFCYEAWKDEWQVLEDYELLAGYLRNAFPDMATQRYYLSLLDTLHGQRHNVSFIEAIRLMMEYVEAPFKPLLEYFSGLAFIELKSHLADSCINRLYVPKLREHLRQIQVLYQDHDVICYTGYDQYDKNSFVYLRVLAIAARSDRYANYHLIEYYLRMREEQAAWDLIRLLDPDEKLLERFALFAFNNSSYDIVSRLTEQLDLFIRLSNPLRARLLVIRQFSRVMKGLAPEKNHPYVFTPSSRYGQKENFACLYLESHINGVIPSLNAREALLSYAVSLQSLKSLALAKKVYDLLLIMDTEHLTILKKYHQLLLDMNSRAGADDVSNRIDLLYLKSRNELDRNERIARKGERYEALAKCYYDIKDFENAALFASKLVDIDPNLSVAWSILLQSLKNIGDGARFAEFSRLQAMLQQKQSVLADTRLLVRRRETEIFRGHMVSKRLLDLIDGLGGSYRVERSFKFIRNRFLSNRFIVTVLLNEPNASRNQEIFAMCRALAVPENCYNLIIQHISSAVKVHFGFEDAGGYSLLKIYLEFPYNHSRRIQGTASDEPWLLLLGFKWDPSTPSRSVISRYSGLPSYTPRQIHAKIATSFPQTSGSIILPFTTAILKMCDNRSPNQPMWYLDVLDEGTLRQSFDVKTYRVRLPLAHLLPLLQDLCRRMNIPAQQFEAHFDTIRDHKFGHLSCGIGRDGEEFLAIYHEVHGQ